MLKKFTFLFFALILSYNVGAQTFWCGTDEYNEKLQQNMSAEELNVYLKERSELFEEAANSSDQSGVIITVPVVIHVYHDNCDGDISKERILQGLQIVNDDFRRYNNDTSNTRLLFKPFAGDAEIQFKLAQIDPSGNCTDGIVRVNTPITNNFPYGNDYAAKNMSHWPGNKYLNIWLVNSIEDPSILGYARFPSNMNSSTYGLVVKNAEWGKGGYHNGRTATHEIGHCLGLYHTFQSSCGYNCSTTGDGICDTPPSDYATFGCVKTQNLCSNDNIGPSPYSTDVVDQIENYMSYDKCVNMFSLGQVAVMRGVFTKYPSTMGNLSSSSNLIATGTNPGHLKVDCKPIPFVCQERIEICQGSSVTFTDLSYDGRVTSRTWSFPGGTPASSSDSVVTVTYNSAGDFDVTLNVGNASGTASKILSKVVSSLSNSPDLVHWRYDENFEEESTLDSLWTIENVGGGNTWELTDKAAYAGVKSIYVYNYFNAHDEVEVLISPSFDLTAVATPKLSFELAYAMRTANSDDYLRLYYSYDCGKYWNVLALLTGGFLESVGAFRTGEFIPPDQSEWRNMSYPLPAFVADKNNVRFKFEFTSGTTNNVGNNLFLDDIKIENLTGLESFNNNSSLKIYPNPASGILYVEIENKNLKVEYLTLSDVSGKNVQSYSRGQLKNVENGSLKMDVSNCKPGLYFITLQSENGESFVRKLIIK